MLQDYVASRRDKFSGWLEEAGIRDQVHLGEPRVLNWLFMVCPEECFEKVTSYPGISSVTKCKLK